MAAFIELQPPQSSAPDRENIRICRQGTKMLSVRIPNYIILDMFPNAEKSVKLACRVWLFEDKESDIITIRILLGTGAFMMKLRRNAKEEARYQQWALSIPLVNEGLLGKDVDIDWKSTEIEDVVYFDIICDLNGKTIQYKPAPFEQQEVPAQQPQPVAPAKVVTTAKTREESYEEERATAKEWSIPSIAISSRK